MPLKRLSGTWLTRLYPSTTVLLRIINNNSITIKLILNIIPLGFGSSLRVARK